MAHRIPFTRVARHPTKSQLVFANGSEFLVVDSTSGNLVRPYTGERKQTYTEQHKSIGFSKDGSLMATSGDNKQINVYDTNTWDLKLSRTAVKRVNALGFDEAGKIVVADKFGDVYCHPVEEQKEGEDAKMAPIVGHVSMVTDMALTPGDKFVVTSDRDEHIRVSHYPNGYNIETFCLGHTDVVTCIKVVPWNGDVLVSAGGDGSLRTWKYLQGQQLSNLDIKQYIKQYTPEATDANSVDPIVASLALEENYKLLAVAFAKTPAILLLRWNDESKGFDYDCTLETPDPVLDICFDNKGLLWATLAPSNESNALVTAFEYKENKMVQVPSDDARVSKINAAEAGLVDTMPDLYSIFGLRKFLDLPEPLQAPAEKNRPKNKKRKVAE
ncbi:hypothetical protein VTP01DRAFT_1009 [Rhizomucor pusillus]|uniref:uncharacterized protein n=1 Tax=Rhizomucor pusillus TaxID=4840 RepID=UPI003741EBEE